MDVETVGHALSVWLLPVVVAITFHEAAHGWMAERCGDNTARLLGRVTFNPIKHVDPFGTLILPGLLLLLKAPFLFGYAKPVPVNFGRLNKPKRDMVWVALAGPGINMVLAFASALLLHAAVLVPGPLGVWIGENLGRSMFINVVLAIFNMLPLPPLDGGRVLTGLLPGRYAWRFAQLERYGLLILIAILFLLPMLAEQLGFYFNPIVTLLGGPLDNIVALIWKLAGQPPLPPSFHG
jgi:Zn-dependent protease